MRLATTASSLAARMPTSVQRFLILLASGCRATTTHLSMSRAAVRRTTSRERSRIVTRCCAVTDGGLVPACSASPRAGLARRRSERPAPRQLRVLLRVLGRSWLPCPVTMHHHGCHALMHIDPCPEVLQCETAVEFSKRVQHDGVA